MWFKKLQNNTKTLIDKEKKKVKENIGKIKTAVQDHKAAIKKFWKEEFHKPDHQSEEEKQTVTEESPRRSKSFEKVEFKAIEDDNELLLCPISQELMTDPVMTPFGHCFQRSSIEEWLGRHNTCPITGQELRIDQLIPCYTIKAIVEERIKGKEGGN